MNTVFGNLFRTPRAKDRSSHPLSDTDAAIDFAPSSPLKSSRKADARLYKPNKPIKRRSPQTSPELGSPDHDDDRAWKRAKTSPPEITVSARPTQMSPVQTQKDSISNQVSSDDNDMSDIAPRNGAVGISIHQVPGVGKHETTGKTAKEAEDDAETFWVIKSIAGHRRDEDSIELRVHWEGGDVSWEPEANLQRDAPEVLFSYWTTAGGRPEHPDGPDMFTIFALHKARKGGKELLVEWLGYPEKSWEPRSTVEEVAPELLDEFSSRQSVRGRPRKQRKQK